MAIGTPTQRYAAQSLAQGASTVFSPATTVAVNSVAILAIACLANKVASSVTDSVGNTYAVDVTAADGTRALSFCSAQIATQITSGDTITVNWNPVTSGQVNIWVQEVTGLATSSVYDTTATATGTGTALATATSPTLALADEIVFGVFRTSADITWTKGASYTDPTTPGIPTGAGAARNTLEYKIVSDATGIVADGTASPSVTWIALAATYKAPSGSGLQVPLAYPPIKFGPF